MPPCKNDASRSYAGTEPSPKGVGYCAHAEKAGSVRAGRDGEQWIVARQGSGVQRWVHHNPVKEQLVAKLNAWWQQLAEGGVMVIKADGAYAMVRSGKATRTAKMKDVRAQWAAAAADDAVVAIVWSGMSRDFLQHFVNFVCQRRPADAAAMVRGDAVGMLARSYKTYFMRDRLNSSKDYLLRGAGGE